MDNNRDKTLKIFMSGDYELLCRLYGISGASGTSIFLTKDTVLYTSRQTLLLVVPYFPAGPKNTTTPTANTQVTGYIATGTREKVTSTWTKITLMP